MSEARRKSSRLTWILTGTVVAVLVMIAGVMLVSGYRQAQVIDEIFLRYGPDNRVVFESTFPEWLDKALASVCGDRHNRMFGRITSVNVRGDWFGDEELLRARGFRHAGHIAIGDSGLTGKGLQSLGLNPTLHSLVLFGNRFDGAELSRLPPLPSLKVLYLTGSPITELGPQVARRFPNLEQLWLDGTQVDDECLREVALLSKLKFLFLNDISITDAGLGVLSQSSMLERLYVARTAVTTAGLEALVDLPRLEVLGLAETQVGDDVEAVLVRMSALKEVDLRGAAASKEVVTRLRRKIATVHGP